jgi:hypothetical protein
LVALVRLEHIFQKTVVYLNALPVEIEELIKCFYQ